VAAGVRRAEWDATAFGELYRLYVDTIYRGTCCKLRALRRLGELLPEVR